jgi:hypothetical protein
MRPRQVRVRIDALVLRGMDPGRRDGFVAGFRAELERLLARAAAGAAFAHERSTPARRLGNLHVTQSEPADRMGRRAAARVAEGIRR